MLDSMGGTEYFGPEKYANVFNYAGVSRDPGAPALTDMQTNDPVIQDLIKRGVISRSDRSGINEGGEFRTIQDTVNWGDPSLPKMTTPNNSFNWIPVGDLNAAKANMIDPSLVYHDANYGWLTPSFNDKANRGDWQDMIGPLVMAAVTFGAGALASGAVAGAGLSAAEAGAGAGAAGAGWAGSTLSSAPWYLSAGQAAAKYLGGSIGNSVGGYANADYGIPHELLTKNTATTKALASTPSFYDPTAYGNMGAMGGFGNTAAPGDGSERVASAVAPDAYGNSYNQVIT